MKIYKYEIRPERATVPNPNPVKKAKGSAPIAQPTGDIRKVADIGSIGAFEIDIPIGARLIKADFVSGRPTMWMIVDEHAETEPRTFACFVTGDDIVTEEWSHLATAKLSTGLVNHLFEYIDPAKRASTLPSQKAEPPRSRREESEIEGHPTP